MTKREIKNFAALNGFTKVRFMRKFNGYAAYWLFKPKLGVAVFAPENSVVLVKDNSIRFALDHEKKLMAIAERKQARPVRAGTGGSATR